MKKPTPKTKNNTGARRRLEKKMPKSKGRSAKISPVETEKIIHELHVYQAELEKQNEQLRQAQIEATEAHKKYADLYDFAPIGCFIFNSEGRIIETNVTGASLLGGEKRSLTGRQFQLFIESGHFGTFQSHLQRSLEFQSKQTCRMKLTRKGGSPFDALIDTTVVRDGAGNFVHYRSFVTDITEIAAVEEKLRSAQEMYRSIVDNVGIGIVMISTDMKILALNRQMQEWFPNVDVSERPTCYKVFHNPPKEAAPSNCPTHQTLQDGLLHEAVIERSAEDEIRYYRVVSTPVRDVDGNLISVIETSEDITENVKFQKRLKESEDRYRTIFETTGTSTMIVEGNGTISLVNRTFEERSGYSRFEVEGKKKWTEFVVEGDIERLEEYRRLRKINPDAVPKSYECRFRKKGGDVRHAVAAVDMIPGTTSVVVSLLDITEIKRAEELLKNRERDLAAKTDHLEEVNTTLKVLLTQRERDKHDLEENVLASVKQLIMPHIKRIKSCSAKDKDKHANIIESKLKDMISPFAHKLTSKYIDLTPKEVQVAYLIREGFTTRQIAESLDISQGTVEFHRENIRHKLDLKNKKANLKSYLLTLP
jgi:PAS domain S-box-containing protein